MADLFQTRDRDRWRRLTKRTDSSASTSNSNLAANQYGANSPSSPSQPFTSHGRSSSSSSFSIDRRTSAQSQEHNPYFFRPSSGSKSQSRGNEASTSGTPTSHLPLPAAVGRLSLNFERDAEVVNSSASSTVGGAPSLLSYPSSSTTSTLITSPVISPSLPTSQPTSFLHKTSGSLSESRSTNLSLQLPTNGEKLPYDERLLSPKLRVSHSIAALAGATKMDRIAHEGSGNKKSSSFFSGFLSNVKSGSRRPTISTPSNPLHVTHVAIDASTGALTVSVVKLARSSHVVH